MTTPIPQPPAIPFLGNVTAIDKELPIRSFQLLAEKYGEIYQLNMLGMTATDILETVSSTDLTNPTGNPLIAINSYALVNELSDEKRFKKKIVAALLQVRNLVGDGLFTVSVKICHCFISDS
jgi:cytochrome P450/NADPH-cytochrome P450 reductase